MPILRTFVRNPVAANVLMLLILGGGLAAGWLIPRELFPEFSVEVITITVPYPEATPEDIEKGVCLKVEHYVSNLEGIKEVSSTSREGVGVVSLELRTDAEVRKVLDDVKSEVDKIEFPKEADDPIVTEMTLKRHVIQVAVSGNAEERTLKEIAEDIEDDLTALPEISQVSVLGVRDYEIHVDVDEQTLRRHGITMADIARAIRQTSFDLPAGRIKTKGGEFALRILGQRYRAEEYENVPVLYKPDGTVIYLRDIATVREGFEDEDVEGLFNGRPSALIGVFKTSEEDAIEITRAVRDYIRRAQPRMPQGIELSTWSDYSRVVSERLSMLKRNGLWGLLLVVLVLWLFLGLRLSFWVAMGIPVSLLGAILVMHMGGQTLNMMSMFALIMALGLIVDDAIIVGENIYSRRQDGLLPADAATKGTAQVLLPVLGAVLTTWIAFGPLLFVEGVMGKFIAILPAAVIVALAFSLLECLTILPSHLAHTLKRQDDADRAGQASLLYPVRRVAKAVRRRIDAAVHRLIYTYFAGLYRAATHHRYATLSVLVAVLVVMAAAYRAGFIRVVTFPRLESDTLRAEVVFPTGTPVKHTRDAAARMTQGAQKLSSQMPTPTGEPIVKDVYTLIGQLSGRRGLEDKGGHAAEVIVELLPAERRGRRLRSEDIKAQWRKNVGPIPGVLALSYGAFRHGPGGTPLEIRVLGETTEEAKGLANDLKDKLATYKGVSDIEDDTLPGKMELKIKPKRLAYALQINTEMLANQLHDAFSGNESIKVQRGRDEIEVVVRYPESLRASLGHLETMRIHTPAGGQVPFTQVADVRMGRGYTTLRRVGGKSVVTVRADVDEERANAEEILNDLRGTYLPALAARVPGAKIDPRGQRHQRLEALGSLKLWFPVALMAIYAVLAVIFKSYFQPMIVMLAIPFGLIGAVIGHWLIGFDVTLLSMFGMVALAGIVVNDSLVLVDRVNVAVRSGEGVYRAAQTGACGRFRPIILTTVTTVAGMSPLLLERSFQAQFLKPMAVSICFGLVFATSLTLIAVPCLYLVGNDVRRCWHWAWHGVWPEPDAVVRRPEVETQAPEAAQAANPGPAAGNPGREGDNT